MSSEMGRVVRAVWGNQWGKEPGQNLRNSVHAGNAIKRLFIQLLGTPTPVTIFPTAGVASSLASQIPTLRATTKGEEDSPIDLTVGCERAHPFDNTDEIGTPIPVSEINPPYLRGGRIDRLLVQQPQQVEQLAAPLIEAGLKAGLKITLLLDGETSALVRQLDAVLPALTAPTIGSGLESFVTLAEDFSTRLATAEEEAAARAQRLTEFKTYPEKGIIQRVSVNIEVVNARIAKLEYSLKTESSIPNDLIAELAEKKRELKSLQKELGQAEAALAEKLIARDGDADLQARFRTLVEAEQARMIKPQEVPLELVYLIGSGSLEIGRAAPFPQIIRELLTQRGVSSQVTSRMRILAGGSFTKQQCQTLLTRPFDGVLLRGALATDVDFLAEIALLIQQQARAEKKAARQ